MNIIAIDIGNTNITAGLFIDNTEAMIEKIAGDNSEELAKVLKLFWQKIPFVKASKDKTKRDGVIIVASVKPDWTEKTKEIVKKELNEKILEIGAGKDIPLPMEVVADFGTAVTIDLVDENGVFLGGTILPGFDISADALHRQTAALPKIDKVQIPKKPFGRNTIEAINNGLYYSAIGALETITRVYSEELGKWPQTVVTGGNMEIIRSGCDFADSFVTDLGVKGIVLAYKKFIGEKD
jgi:type III pantothenate kinase